MVATASTEQAIAFEWKPGFSLELELVCCCYALQCDGCCQCKHTGRWTVTCTFTWGQCHHVTSISGGTSSVIGRKLTSRLRERRRLWRYVDLRRCSCLKIGCWCCGCGCWPAGWLDGSYDAVLAQCSCWKSVGAACVWHQMFVCGCECVVYREQCRSAGGRQLPHALTR